MPPFTEEQLIEKVQAGYIVVFGALAYGRFLTKDILS